MKKKKTDGAPNGVLGTVIIIVVMIVVFGLVFAWMYSVDLLFLPDFVEDLLGLSDDGDEVEWELGELQSLIKNGKNTEGETVAYDITYENIKTAFLSGKVPEGEYVSAAVSYHTSGDFAQRKVCYYRNGEKYRSELYKLGEDSALETVIIGDADRVSIIDTATGEYSTLPAASDITFENEIGIPSLSELISKVEEFPESLGVQVETGIDTDDPEDSGIAITSADDADTSEFTDCELKLLKTEKGNVYYVAFTYSEPQLREEYYLSLDHRMIIFMQSTQDETPIYTYEARRISHDSELYADESLYDLSKAAKQ